MAKIAVKTMGGKAAGNIELPDAVFATPVNTYLIHEAVVAHQAAGRAGTHATKNRSDVRGGGKKPWKQKKTGRARHGSIRSPIWKGGGTVFGPQPRDYTLGLPRKKRQGALRSALSAKVRDGHLVVVDSFELQSHKTKDLLRVLEGLGIGSSALLVDEPANRNLALSARNVPGYKAALATGLNVVDLLHYEMVVLSQAALQRVAEVLEP